MSPAKARTPLHTHADQPPPRNDCCSRMTLVGWSLIERFLVYGALGWCVEVLFTGLCAFLLEGDRTATGKTYLWMHPIYGFTALSLELTHDVLATVPWLVRIAAYLMVIYVAEFTSGALLRALIGRCPWDYGTRGVNLLGLVRLDYAPFWLLVSCFFEPTRAFAATITGL
jgi:uncharacterized membrane protein